MFERVHRLLGAAHAFVTQRLNPATKNALMANSNMVRKMPSAGLISAHPPAPGHRSGEAPLQFA